MVMKKAAKKSTSRSSTKSPAKSTTKSTTGKSKVKKVMKEYKEGKLHSGSKSGPQVKNRKQAVAIALSEARKHGATIPKKKTTSKSKKTK